MMSPFQSIVIIQAPSVSLKELGDALQEKAHSNQISLSTRAGCRKEHLS
jgi:hypothetical protein